MIKFVSVHFFREDIQMDNQHMKRCPIPLACRETQSKMTMRYQFISTLIAKIKEASVDKEMKKLEYFITAVGNIKQCICFGKQLLWQFPERLDRVIT